MKVYKYGDNVDTDVIIPARYLNAPDEKSLASHCMEDIDAGFASTVEPGDIIVDYDRLADALMPGMPDDTPVPDAVRDLVAGAWQGAYRNAVTLAKPVSLWLVKVMPGTQRSPRLLDEWLALDYDIHVCDPGKPVVVERLEELKAGRRELASMRQWYRSGITQAGIDSRQKARRARLASLGLRDGEPTTPVVASSPPVRARPRW